MLYCSVLYTVSGFCHYLGPSFLHSILANMFGFLFKKSKGLDKESKGSLKQSAKDLLSRRNSTTSATSSKSSNNISTTALSSTTCSSGSGPTTIAPLPKSKSMDSLIEDGSGEAEFFKKEDMATALISDSPAPQHKIPVVLVSSDSLCDLTNCGQDVCEEAPVTRAGSNASQRSRSEERSCSRSSGSSANGDSTGHFCCPAPRSSSLTNLLQSSSGEEISRTSGIGTSEDALLKSLMSDTEIEFIDETIDENIDENNDNFEENEVLSDKSEVDDDNDEVYVISYFCIFEKYYNGIINSMCPFDI